MVGSMANQSSPAVRQLVGCGQLGVTVLVSDMPHTERDAENIQAWRTAASMGGLHLWVDDEASRPASLCRRPSWTACLPMVGSGTRRVCSTLAAAGVFAYWY